MTTRGEDHRRGRRRKIIVSDETKDIEAPAEIGTRGWGGRGWALSLSAVAMDQSELPRAMPTGAIERFIVSCAYPQQANSQQSTSPEWVILIHCFCFPTRIFNALSCILAWFFVVISVFFHDENAIYPKGPIDRVVRSESIAHFRWVGFQEMNV
jgi:hypothetical protein